MKKLFITTAMASMLCMGFVSCADELNIKSIDPQSSPTYTAEGLLAKQYATLGLTGQKGPAGSADLSGDEGESGFIRTVFNLQELMTDEILWAWQDNEGIAAITNMNWDKSNARVNWAYQRLIFDITLYNQFISEQTGKMSEDKIAEVRFLRALNYYYFLDLYRKAPFKETFDSNLPIEKSGKDLYEWLDNELTTIEPMMQRWVLIITVRISDVPTVVQLMPSMLVWHLTQLFIQMVRLRTTRRLSIIATRLSIAANMTFLAKQRMATAVTSSCSWATMIAIQRL